MPNWDISRGFLSVYIIYISDRISTAAMAGDIIFFILAGPVGDYTGLFSIYYSTGRFNEAAMGGAKVGGHMINKYDHKRAVLYFRGFFYKTGIFVGFPLHNINFAERNSEAAMGRMGRGEHFIF